MLEFLNRAKSYDAETERFNELKPRVQAVFDACVLFIKTARKEGEETTIFYFPFVSWWHYHFTNIDPNTQVGVELHQSGPRNKPTEVTIHVISPILQELYEAGEEEYILRTDNNIVMHATHTGDHYQPLSASDLENRLPFLEEITQKLVAPEAASNP